MKMRKWLLLSVASIAVLATAYAATFSVNRYFSSSTGKQIYDLRSDGTQVIAGSLNFGDNSTSSSITRPSLTNAFNYCVKVPVFNVGPAVVAGNVLIASNTATGNVTASVGTATNTIVGVAAESIASGAVGMMVPRGGGYSVVKTTGAVSIGQVLVTSATATGFAGGTSSPTAGTGIGVALSVGAAAGDTVLAILQ